MPQSLLDAADSELALDICLPFWQRRAMSMAPAAPTPSGTRETTKLRIGFFVRFPFHQEILGPIHALLRDEFPCLLTPDVEEVIRFEPHILFVSDRFLPRYRRQLPGALLIYTRHGFISKNYAWGVFGEADFVCVSSPWVRDDCARRGWQPQMGFWITGFVPMDNVLSDLAARKQPAMPASFSPKGPTLLYAPTFNRFLNSVEMLGTDWIRQLRARWPDLNVILKPHPHTAERSPESMAILNALAATNERTLLVAGDANIYDLMPMADVLISDASSVAFYYLACDRPIILLNNPRRFEEPRFFDPEGQEWTWRDMALEIDAADTLPDALQRCLEHPEEKAERRAFYRERVFGDLLDGSGAARIAGYVRALAAEAPQDQPWVEIAWNSSRTVGQLRKKIEQLSAAIARPVVVDLKKYPKLQAAVQRNPELQSELSELVKSALRDKFDLKSTPEKSAPDAAEVKNV
jgi:hypothetical protein